MRVFLSQRDASEWLKKGKILIYPTEGVWGIGCDALNEKAVKRIYELKNRPQDKSLILLCKNLESISNFLIPLTKKEMEYLDTISKDPVTVLYKFDIDTTPGHLQNSTGKLAIRVSTHYHLKTLFERFNNPIISTSANISGSDTINNIEEFKADFDFNDVAIYNKPLGNLSKPTPIIDLETKEVIRD